MRLPDFDFDPAFVRLREAIGASEIVQLRAPEWKDWDGFGIDIADINEIEVNPDSTLSYQGRRVLVYIRDQSVEKDDGLRDFRYHVAECGTLINMRKEKRFQRYVVTTRTDGRFVVNLSRWGEAVPFEQGFVREMEVCKNCLTTLNWRGYVDLASSEKNNCWSQFGPDEFLAEYGSRVKGLPTFTPETAPLNQYPEDWNEISRRARERSGWTCQRCGVVFKEPRTRNWLQVHHRDGNKANSSPGNLEALCIGCHKKEFGHERLKFSPGYDDFLRWRRTQI
jgi:hypothetical protein